ncbi:hypothetical protein S7711_10309 [Stachybotrys chartarum IBT 7711]|uniref:Uncharacterized protein n=1 Tax=Stachybotrys chartarum (strain CBS 109288 / IBT 7711) TaxID=1280523 RepID=A0A084BAC3_STACB|nr:hypothetical protein S7711_10309 [Stachybotrys chartarum IBT 7711]
MPKEDEVSVYSERMYRFYVRQGIAEGIAWRYVSDIPLYLDQYNRAEPTL